MNRFSCLAVAALLAGCGEKPEPRAVRPPDAPPAQSPLVGSESVAGLSALHDTVLNRALRGDTLGLLRLFVRDSVYRVVVWPTQPSYEPGREEVWRLVSGMNKANSNKGLRRLLTDITEVSPGDPDVRKIPPFARKKVAGGVLYSREKKELRVGELSLFAAVLCLKGRCQVLTYANGGRVGKPATVESVAEEAAGASAEIRDSREFISP